MTKCSPNLQKAYEELVSLNPKVRSDAAFRAVNQEFWLSSSPPEWFSVAKYPNVIGFDDSHVIYGTNIKNIKVVSWESLQTSDIVVADDKKAAA